ncbi:DUF3048 domain-containing protein [Sporosarcina sp. ACRSM]|uniref:DUF3048 domain-containing protein n=1 Tax=Sporosarcina sp. ACRSM TaxID=2918216 RepID=UPI001EF52275|nr:DUF3048 domain-containing protein [Sporosarcina sp. ACRSM]MCG7337404.1 DUF3048 domain-containing protein [Sporosarcina sp. ACRSM]
MRRKWKGWFVGLTAAILLLTACNNDEEVKEPVTGPLEEEEIVQEEEPVTSYAAPFTGILSEEETTRRPVLVTINNHPLARPQSGISDADIVYELAAEGNVTRLLALFQSELPEEIGPVRSARDYFVHISKGLDAFYVAHGYSPDAQQLLQSNFVDNVNGMQYDGTLFWRSKDRRAPHNSYISGENILAGAEKTDSTMEMDQPSPFSFHESIEDAKIGDQASTITVSYSADPKFTSNYSYDVLNGTYERTVNDVLTIDKVNDAPVELSNILVFETAHRTIDNEGRQAVDLETGGKGMLFQAGLVKAIEWENKDDILMPMENGSPVKLVPGKTWIHIVSTKPGMDQSVTFMP